MFVLLYQCDQVSSEPSCCLINIKILDTKYRCYTVVYRPASLPTSKYGTLKTGVYTVVHRPASLSTPKYLTLNTNVCTVVSVWPSQQWYTVAFGIYTLHRPTEVWCSVVQWVAVSCSVLQWVAVCCSVVQWVAVCCSVLQCVAVC